MTKERPIRFSGPMVRAILDGRKTQTRRVVKPQPDREPSKCHYSSSGWAHESAQGGCTCSPIACPYATDTLWVRETWGVWCKSDIFRKNRADVTYAAGSCERTPLTGQRWRPSIHMPRWASRITLEVTGVRVERLQQISHKDALAEGVDYDVSKPDGWPLPRFQKLWDSINAKRGYGWEKNPWVWVVSFKPVKG